MACPRAVQHRDPRHLDDAVRSRSGITAGVDDNGALLVQTGERVERIVAGEVTWW